MHYPNGVAFQLQDLHLFDPVVVLEVGVGPQLDPFHGRDALQPVDTGRLVDVARMEYQVDSLKSGDDLVRRVLRDRWVVGVGDYANSHGFLVTRSIVTAELERVNCDGRAFIGSPGEQGGSIGV